MDDPTHVPRAFRTAEKLTLDLMAQKLLSFNIEVSERFRFQSFNHLKRICDHGYKVGTEEMLMISLTRLSFPYRWSDLYERFPGRKRWFLQGIFYFFLDFMIANWSCLLLNNMDWWKKYFYESTEAIRIKLLNINHANWRLVFPPAELQNGFRYVGFIDNTMVAFCRPGGVMGDGAAAPRVPLEVQQAWWTGWKKLHGMKWQTVVLANGMDLQVYGPLSVRQNDLDTLVLSNLEEDFELLMEGDEIQYKLFGDSA